MTLCLVEFARWRHQSAAAPRAGARSAVLDCVNIVNGIKAVRIAMEIFYAFFENKI